MSEDDEPIEEKKEAHLTPQARAGEKLAELRMHSELAAIFEGPRKFEAQVVVGLDPDVARDVQRSMAKFEKAKIESTPILSEPVIAEAKRILTLCDTAILSSSDYHLYRRPGELMIVRWLAGEEVETFYGRYQAHCDAALEGIREDERSALEWRSDEKTKAYLAELDRARLPATQMYLREPILKHGLFAISTTAADEMNIRFLATHLMGVEIADLTGPAGAPGDDAMDSELAWFFKLFGIRGLVDGVERMCFFTYLQKSDDSFES